MGYPGLHNAFAILSTPTYIWDGGGRGGAVVSDTAGV